jgi:SAM-dependent methyltransferase
MKFWNHERDVEKEYQRYNYAGSLELSNDAQGPTEGFSHFPKEHLAPFEEYYMLIGKEILKVKDVLEIGAGTGQHTRPTVTPSTTVTALDISEISLEVLRKKFNERINLVVGNIEELPFSDSSFDLIVSCGVLSYGDPLKVDSEILRTLRPGGTFIFIDSLNHNPIYKINRWIKFIRRTRSASTVLRIPKVSRIERLSAAFEEKQYSFFGQWLWVHQFLSVFVGAGPALKFYNFLENSTPKSKYAFKVVGILKGKRP